MKIIVCHESSSFRQRLIGEIRELLAKSRSYSDISLRVTECADTPELWESLSDGGTDLVFWNIDVHQREGFALAESLWRKHPTLPIVFVTEQKDAEWLSFGFHPFRCLRREFQREELQDVLLDALELLHKESAFLSVINRNECATVKLSQIVYVEKEKESNYLLIHCVFATYRSRGVIRDLARQLKRSDFIQISQSLIVNMNSIASLKKREVVLSDQTHLPLSLSFSGPVRSAYVEYLQRKKHL